MMLFRQLLFTLALFIVASAILQAQEIGQSWKEMSFRMLSSGNLDSAQIYLERWLEADPGDESSWYNLACVYALGGEKEKALHAWEMSVAAGWEDPVHPLNDSDLESIRSDGRFTTALEKVQNRQDAKEPKNAVRNFLETRRVGTYIALLPNDYHESNRDYPLCIILHGSGSTERAYSRLTDGLGREGIIYIIPRAPYTHSSVHKATGNIGYTAWTPEKIDSLDPLYTEVAPMYAEWIMSCAEDARNRYRIDDEPVMILGHSQGGAFSWITATLYPTQVGSIFAYAGYFPDEFCTKERVQGVFDQSVRVTLAHGTADNVVGPEESKKLDGVLEEWGIDHSLTLYDGTGHGLTEDVRQSMKEWVDREGGR